MFFKELKLKSYIIISSGEEDADEEKSQSETGTLRPAESEELHHRDNNGSQRTIVGSVRSTPTKRCGGSSASSSTTTLAPSQQHHSPAASSEVKYARPVK